MTILLPPSLYADCLVLRRAGWTAMARPIIAPVLLVSVCVILTCISLYSGSRWCAAASAILALGGSFALAHSRLLEALAHARSGWCGALPVRRGSVALALLGLTAAALAMAVASGSVLLVVAAMAAPRRDTLGLALLALDGGLVVGTYAAGLVMLRKGVVVRSRHAEGIREPLFTLWWLDDARLPHLLDWQRRAALVRWRRGGSFVMVGIVLAAVPMGAFILDVAGLVMLTLSLVWLAVVMRASATAMADALHLLGATPLSAGRMRSASLRYPLVALFCSMVLAAIGLLLLRGGFVPMAAWIVCAAAISLHPLFRIIKTMPPGWSP